MCGWIVGSGLDLATRKLRPRPPPAALKDEAKGDVAPPSTVDIPLAPRPLPSSAGNLSYVSVFGWGFRPRAAPRPPPARGAGGRGKRGSAGPGRRDRAGSRSKPLCGPTGAPSVVHSRRRGGPWGEGAQGAAAPRVGGALGPWVPGWYRDRRRRRRRRRPHSVRRHDPKDVLVPPFHALRLDDSAKFGDELRPLGAPARRASLAKFVKQLLHRHHFLELPQFKHHDSFFGAGGLGLGRGKPGGPRRRVGSFG